MSDENKIIDVKLSDLEETYSKFRVIDDGSAIHLLNSMSKYGQISPIVVSEGKNNKYEIIDGHKRLKVALKLKTFTHLKAKILPLGDIAIKVAILQLNLPNMTVNEFEEALILASLFHDNKLTQVEIAKLFDRHKSWVSRRISIADRLCNELQEQLKLGIVSASIVNELAKLPRGNQEQALATIQKHVMNCRETVKLVKDLLSTPKRNWETILSSPVEILDERHPPRPSSKQKKIIQSQFLEFKQKLCDFEQSCSAFDLFFGPAENNLSSEFELEQEKEILSLINKDIELLKKVIFTLEKFREVINVPF